VHLSWSVSARKAHESVGGPGVAGPGTMGGRGRQQARTDARGKRREVHLAPQQMELRQALPEDPTEARLLRALEEAGEPRHIDELCREMGLPVAQVSGTLVMLELKGLARLVGPMTYAR